MLTRVERLAELGWASVILALLAACGSKAPEKRRSIAPDPIRLIDQLASAEIRSPLRTTPSLETLLADLKASAAGTRWAADLRATSTYRQHGCRVDAAGLLRCGEVADHFWARLEIPVKVAAYSAIELELRASHPACVEITLGDGAETRLLSLPADDTEWRVVSPIWLGRADASEVLVRLERRRLPQPCQVDVRSLSAFELGRGPDLSLALLKDLSPARGADPGLGIGKFGTFLPLGDPETVQPPFDGNFAAREVLFAPAPTDLGFRLRLPRRGRLRFSYALSRESQIGDAVDFEVLATGPDGVERSLWSRRLALRDDNWHWHEATVPLGKLADQTLELTLRTRSSGERGFALWGTPTIDVPRDGGSPPNVILVAVDTLRADRLSAYGYTRPTTPRLDEFARQSVRFDHVISQSNWTLPSFASVFTGQIVARHRVASLMDDLGSDADTLAQQLRDHGWRTHAILEKPALYRRLDRGFEVSFNVPKKNHRADEGLRKAVDWLRQAQDSRFFLFLHFDDPHQPFTHPESFVLPRSAAALNALGLELPLFLPDFLLRCESCRVDGKVTAPIKTLARDLYDEEITYVDDRIGRLLDELREMGLYDDAVIAFLSDHGETLWDHYEWFHHGGVSQHSELIRVPLILKPPLDDRYRRGAVVETQVRLFDVMPTLLELAGIRPADDELDAASLGSFLRSESAGSANRPAFSQGAHSAAFQVGSWKYIAPVGRGIYRTEPEPHVLAAEELYDLSRDPEELHDLSGDSGSRLQALRADAMEYLVRAAGGRFLVVLIDGDASGLEVTCRPACSWDPLIQFGLERIETIPPSTDVFGGRGLIGRLFLFARFWSAPQAELEVSLTGPSEATNATAMAARRVPFEEGVMGRLTGHSGPGAWILEAPERAAARPDPAADMDSRQYEALRALGYLQ